MSASFRSLRRVNDYLARRVGLRIARVRHAQTDYRQYQFSMPVDMCVNSYGYSYRSCSLDHPFISTLHAYADAPDMAVEDSPLFRFWSQFNPHTLQEALFEDDVLSHCKTASIRYVEGIDPFQVNPMPTPWSNDAKLRRYHMIKPRERPAADAHFKRLTRLFDSIRKHGYLPETYSDRSLRHGFIRGCLLKDGDACRFVILGGQHRLAVLSVLGYKMVPVIFDYHMLHTPPVVDIDSLEYWPVIRRGLYDTSAAYRVFARFFRDKKSPSTEITAQCAGRGR